ncbi:RagB/SusD family nutrient uptake outer membrane protein [Arcticibacter sp. MXS-1]|uniref:RagB/SusD family nutrient uptake outer membrane protein n=1 Tax=Arcticibacter sp. MXS-1 TaxID=3341726 RepID=UPI0035A8E95E
MKTIKFSIAALLLIFAAGCKDFLEEDNKSNIVADTYYTTTEGYEKLINSAYSTLRNVYAYTGTSSAYLFEAGTDMYVEGRTGDQPKSLSEYRNLNPDDPYVLAFYTNLYRSIQVCNTALYFNEHTAASANLPQRKGEMQFLRAYYYFLLVQTFGGVPIVTDYLKEPKDQFGRNTEAEVYDFIISEMKAALDLVPETAQQYGRVNKRAVRHYLAKVYLTKGYLTKDYLMGDYSEPIGKPEDFVTAAQYADQAINGQKLTTSFEDLFYPGNEKDPEIVFSIQYDPGSLPTQTTGGNGQGNFFGPYQGGQGGTQGYPWRNYALCPTMYVFDAFTANDARFDATFMINYYQRYYDYYDRKAERANLNIKYYYKPKWDTRTAEQWKAEDPAHRNNATVIPYSPDWEASQRTVADNATPTVKKFDDPKSLFSVGNGSSTRDLFLARLGETYLIAAEAYLRANNTALAAERINEVRKRAAKPGKAAEMMISAADVNTNFILDERARELVGEFHRWFDLKRTGTLVDRTKTLNREIKVNWFDKNINPFLGPDGKLKILRPIPTTAIDLNKGAMTQNPGY